MPTKNKPTKNISSIDTIIKQEGCEALLRQVFIHLRRAFRIGSRAKEVNNPVGALLIIKNEVEAISSILEENKHAFLQPRIYLHRLNGTTQDNFFTAKLSIDNDVRTTIKTEFDADIVKREVDAEAAPFYPALPSSTQNHETGFLSTGNDDSDHDDVDLPPPSLEDPYEKDTKPRS